MKTTLLKKIRKEHPIYFNSKDKLYQYRTTSGRFCSGDIWEPDFESEWVNDYKTLLNKRSELILRDAHSYFSDRWFCYKRKRPLKVYRIF